MFDARQRRILAYALALSGGSIASARRWLASNSVECPDVSESTLRRVRDDPALEAEIEEQRQIIREEQGNAIREAERARIKRDIEGTFVERIRAMEAKGWELFEAFSDWLEKNPPANHAERQQMLAFWIKTQEFVIRLKKDAGAGVHELWQAECLVRATRQALQAELGPALTDKLLRNIGKVYETELTRHQTKTAEEDNGKETVAASAS